MLQAASAQDDSLKNRNNLFWIRHCAALGVLLGHSYALLDKVAPKVFGEQVHIVALKVFFIISGYLVCQSWERDKSLTRYLLKRALRIFPGLIMVVCITALIIGPLTTEYTAQDYFHGQDFRVYFWNIGLAPYFHLPGVFKSLAPNDGVNGSLWSLPVEFAMYFLVPIFSCSRHSFILKLVNVILVLALSIASIFYQTVGNRVVDPVFYWTSLPYALQVAAFFACASWFKSFELERFLNLQAALAIAVLLQLDMYSDILSQFFMLLGLPYVILSLGLAPNAIFASRERFGDASYGIYLYAFPMQQCIILWLGKEIQPLVLTMLALPVTTAFAFLSWHAVEKHALKWKPRLRIGKPIRIHRLELQDGT